MRLGSQPAQLDRRQPSRQTRTAPIAHPRTPSSSLRIQQSLSPAVRGARDALRRHQPRRRPGGDHRIPAHPWFVAVQFPPGIQEQTAEGPPAVCRDSWEQPSSGGIAGPLATTPAPSTQEKVISKIQNHTRGSGPRRRYRLEGQVAHRKKSRANTSHGGTRRSGQDESSIVGDDASAMPVGGKEQSPRTMPRIAATAPPASFEILVSMLFTPSDGFARSDS